MHLFKFNFAPESHAVKFKDFKRKFKAVSSSNQSDIICKSKDSWLKEESHLDIERDYPCDEESRNL